MLKRPNLTGILSFELEAKVREGYMPEPISEETIDKALKETNEFLCKHKKEVKEYEKRMKSLNNSKYSNELLRELKKMDKYYLELAIEEAKKDSIAKMGYRVGAVIVKNDRIISKAFSYENLWHYHAEEWAIMKSRRERKDLRGSTLYSTMEPCDARSIPDKESCCNLIIESGIKRVVYGVEDPEKHIICRGIEKLLAKGIEVVHIINAGS